MFAFGFNEVNNKSGNGMRKATLGLTLSYSFYRHEISENE